MLSFPLLLILLIMFGIFQISSYWWLVAIIVGVAFAALWWWLRKPTRQAQAPGGESQGDPLDDEVVEDAAGTAQVLNDFFGAPEPAASVPSSQTPRLTAHPLAQIIAHARVDSAPPPAKAESPAVPTQPTTEDRGKVVNSPADAVIPASGPSHDKGHDKDAELARMKVELERLTVRYKALDKEAFIHSAHNKQLEAEIAELRAGLVPPDAPTQEDIDRLMSEMAAVKQQLASEKSENMALSEKLRAASAVAIELENTRQDLAAAEELLRAAESLVEPAGSAAPLAPEVPPVDTSAWEREIQTLRDANEALRAEIAELKAMEPVAQPVSMNGASVLGDDLTDIKGIAKVLNRKLNERGISTFRQIALLTEAEIASLSEALGLKNRITRDHWQAQARRLHTAKHGEVLPEREVAGGLLPLNDLPLEAAGRSAE